MRVGPAVPRQTAPPEGDIPWTSTTRQRSIRLQTTGEAVQTDIAAGGEGIREAIGCDRFDVISLEHGIDLWVDDEGLLMEQPQLNLPATVLAHASGVATAVFGAALVLGVEPETGESRGLSEAQLRRVRQVLAEPGQEAIAAVTRTIGCLLRPRW